MFEAADIVESVLFNGKVVPMEEVFESTPPLLIPLGRTYDYPSDS